MMKPLLTASMRKRAYHSKVMFSSSQGQSSSAFFQGLLLSLQSPTSHGILKLIFYNLAKNLCAHDSVQDIAIMWWLQLSLRWLAFHMFQINCRSSLLEQLEMYFSYFLLNNFSTCLQNLVRWICQEVFALKWPVIFYYQKNL